MLYVCVRSVMDVVFYVCIVTRGAVGDPVWEVSVSSCRCCMLVSCVHPVAVLNFVSAGRGCKRLPYGRVILQSWTHDCLIGSHECLLLLL